MDNVVEAIGTVWLYQNITKGVENIELNSPENQEFVQSGRRNYPEHWKKLSGLLK